MPSYAAFSRVTSRRLNVVYAYLIIARFYAAALPDAAATIADMFAARLFSMLSPPDAAMIHYYC